MLVILCWNFQSKVIVDEHPQSNGWLSFHLSIASKKPGQTVLGVPYSGIILSRVIGRKRRTQLAPPHLRKLRWALTRISAIILVGAEKSFYYIITQPVAYTIRCTSLHAERKSDTFKVEPVGVGIEKFAEADGNDKQIESLHNNFHIVSADLVWANIFFKHSMNRCYNRVDRKYMRSKINIMTQKY